MPTRCDCLEAIVRVTSGCEDGGERRGVSAAGWEPERACPWGSRGAGGNWRNAPASDPPKCMTFGLDEHVLVHEKREGEMMGVASLAAPAPAPFM